MSNVYLPPDSLQAEAEINSLEKYRQLVEKAEADPENYWSQLADRYIDWFAPPNTILDDSGAPFYKWFAGGTLNASYLCLDRHIEKNGDHTALIWESEQGAVKTFSYKQLLEKVNQLANTLKTEFGIGKGDRVVLYMPMIPESAIAMLACARLGAIHVVVFGGFSAEVLAERAIDTDAKLIITADGACRRGQTYFLKPTVDDALKKAPHLHAKVLVVPHLSRQGEAAELHWQNDRDFDYDQLVEKQSADLEPEVMDSEDELFVLHTSGSTGKPKGIVHSTAGYMLWAQWTTEHVFSSKPDDIFWCTADVGWITGHTYVIYGPLALGQTTVMYEGVPVYPDAARWWKMIEAHKANQFYTAPTAIRMLHKSGADLPKNHDLSSLKVLGTVGEPIDPEAWQWYYDVVGGGNCPIVDTWWQTETGGNIITPLPAATPLKPGVATLPLPGLAVEILEKDGSPTPDGEKGLLCITKPWPSMLRGVWGAPKRYEGTYFKTVSKNGQPVYFSGDGAYKDEDGYIVITGRVDDVINTAGHRVGTAEVESALADHPAVAESGVVGVPDDIRGEKIVAFVVLKDGQNIEESVLATQLNQLLKTHLGPVVQVSQIFVAPGLPKTRSGKILRRILRHIASAEPVTADISTLEDSTIVAKLEDLVRDYS